MSDIVQKLWGFCHTLASPPMKKLLVPFAVVAALTGCVAVRLKPGASVTVTTTNAPPVLHSYSVVTNSVRIPDSYTVRLDASSQAALVSAIEAAGNRTNVPIVVTQTNSNPINIFPVVTNTAVFPSSVKIVLDQETIDKLKPGRWSSISPFLTTLLGAIVALAGSQFVFRDQKKSDEKKKKNILCAIHAEIQAMKDILDSNFIPFLSSIPANGIYNHRSSLTVNWLTVYEANSEYLGRFDPDTVKELVGTRAKILILFESLRINNGLLDKWAQIGQFPFPPQANAIVIPLTPKEQELYPYFQTRAELIKERHEEMEVAVTNLFKHLETKGIK